MVLLSDRREAGRAGVAEERERRAAAEAEIDARAPLAVKHGKVMERGASGFTGWVQGMRRTSDAAALKRMYKALKPNQVGELEGELHIEGSIISDSK